MEDNIQDKLIQRLRTDLDTIDHELMDKLVKRFDIARQIINMKKSQDISVTDSDRENEIMKSLFSEFSARINKRFINELYSLIFEESKREHLDNDDSVPNPLIIAGPCSIESEDQINNIATTLADLGISYLRGGTYKARTCPTSFQGLGTEGMQYLRNAADQNNMKTVTEILDMEQLEEHYDSIDIVQIGSRNMSSYSLLKEVGKITAKDKKPVLLKRGFSATLNELINAAQYIINEGNDNIYLCLRGIRTFEQIDSCFRFTPDLASISELKSRTNLKVLFDPSHSTGKAEFVIDIAKSALLLGADGLIIETHNKPEEALCDGPQSILPETLKSILEFIELLPSIRS